MAFWLTRTGTGVVAAVSFQWEMAAEEGSYLMTATAVDPFQWETAMVAVAAWGFLPATPSAAHEEQETGGGGFLPVAEEDACVSRLLGEEEDDDDEEPDWDLLSL